MTNTTKAPSPLKIARQERDAAYATLSLYKQVHRWATLGKAPDITRVWSGHLECDEHDSAYHLLVAIRWWSSCRGDEGIIEILVVDTENEGASDVEVYSAMDLRSLCAQDAYRAPWRYVVRSMLAISLAARADEARRNPGTTSPRLDRWNLED